MQLLMVTEVAKILRVSRSDVYTLIKNGHLGAMKLGSLKVPESEVQRFIETNIGNKFIDFEEVEEMIV
ncbi:helix-turn-helix domain-containing protein [uncultured Clostridium sp.]|uniref:helix-turn-helix domain-containing protein n=1 Tax=uncultured Clostridium sp. TaxID=59620 RepID=UPI0026129BFF|nr:helix-turn-helix domain-containing protein [uncultured Clostridium sp.]